MNEQFTRSATKRALCYLIEGNETEVVHALRTCEVQISQTFDPDLPGLELMFEVELKCKRSVYDDLQNARAHMHVSLRSAFEVALEAKTRLVPRYAPNPNLDLWGEAPKLPQDSIDAEFEDVE